MQTVSELTAAILRREGGFVNDPDDPGGPTNRGITLGTLRRLGLDLTGDGAIDIGDVHAVTAADAAAIFERFYFREPGLHRLPESVQGVVYDTYVHAGARAVKLLQDVLNDGGEILAVDGICGPLTVAAAFRRERRDGAVALVDAYSLARRRFYYRLAAARPASRKYVRRRDGGKGGWILRAEAFLSDALHLDAAGHAARVAAWD
ncbi:MAG: holin-associated N-acetylmuramidase [Rubricella sp.]